MQLLSDEQIASWLEDRDWARQGDQLVRERAFSDFRAAIGFVERVAETAESVNHHPDILVHGWNKVRLSLSTHSAGGLTQADLDLADRLDRLH